MATTKTPKPLPDIRQDPAFIAAMDLQDAYPRVLASIRDDTSTSLLQKAEKVSTAYHAQSAEIARLATDLYDRRVARLTYLQQQIPLGPGIPDDASPADRAVLTTAFRCALDKARDSKLLTDRKQLLAEALKFNDDAGIRGVLTAAEEDSQTELFDQWGSVADMVEVVAEARVLALDISGMGPSRPWMVKAFAQPARPIEEGNLGALMQHEQRRQATELQSKARTSSRPVWEQPGDPLSEVNRILGYQP